MTTKEGASDDADCEGNLYAECAGAFEALARRLRDADARIRLLRPDARDTLRYELQRLTRNTFHLTFKLAFGDAFGSDSITNGEEP